MGLIQSSVVLQAKFAYVFVELAAKTSEKLICVGRKRCSNGQSTYEIQWISARFIEFHKLALNNNHLFEQAWCAKTAEIHFARSGCETCQLNTGTLDFAQTAALFSSYRFPSGKKLN